MAKKFYAGMETDAACRRCKMETRHRVLSITERVPEKLICNACGSIHRFKSERVVSEAAASRPKTVRKAAPTASNLYQSMVTEQAGAIAQPYGQGVEWEAGMWVDHPAFGLGKVQNKTGRKITVHFLSGVKTLIAV